MNSGSAWQLSRNRASALIHYTRRPTTVTQVSINIPEGKAKAALTDPLRYDRAMTTPPFRIPSKRLTPGKPINVLLVGGGGREHALARRLKQSPHLGDLFITHGENPGLASLGKAVDVPVSIREIYRLVQFCEKNAVDLVVIGPEDPLAEGYADKLRDAGMLVFGPNKDGARLEADKAWAKQLMRGASIPTGDARTFTDANAAIAYVESREHPPVVKASGLAKGKGVIVPSTKDEAIAAIKMIMVERAFGDSGSTVVLEEKLKGPEVSLLAIVDGRNILVLPAAQDHKRLGDNDTGPNTGGMGAFCPSALIDDSLLARIEREVLVPTVDAVRREGIDYRGVIFVGLMLTHGGPKVLEFNCRFGDPECEAIMARFKGDLLELLVATCEGKLDQVDVSWDARHSCCVILAAPGYPDKPAAGVEITGVDKAEKMADVFVDYAGVKRDSSGSLVTAGGRVFAVTGLGATLEEARTKAYAACNAIEFRGKVMRTDIGKPRHTGK